MCTLALHSSYQGKPIKSKFNIVFEVKDIETVREELTLRGIDKGEILDAAPGIRVCDGNDPEGNSFYIEMVEKWLLRNIQQTPFISMGRSRISYNLINLAQ